MKKKIPTYPLTYLRNIEFSIQVKSIPKYEEDNSYISINVIRVNNNGQIGGPLYHIKETKPHHVNFLLTSRNGNSQRLHYCLISDLSKLYRNTAYNRNIQIICDRYQNHFYSIEKLNKYREECENYRICATKITEAGIEDGIIKFRNYKVLLKCPFVTYADFECLNTEIEDRDYELET